MALEDRFWNKVLKSPDSDMCWCWNGALMPQGYGIFHVGRSWNASPRRVVDYAHRIAWRLTNGPIPKSMNVLHSCDNRRCVNPRHLRLGTQKENVSDMLSRKRFGGGATRGLFGIANPSSKLDDADVVALRACYLTGRWGYRRLGELFGITPIAVKKIVLRTTWRHIA